MTQGWFNRLGPCIAAGLLLAACGSDIETATGLQRSADAARGADEASSTQLPATSTSTAPTTTAIAVPDSTPPDPTTTAPTTTAAIERVVVETGYSPFAVAGEVVLHHPVSPTERIGFHQAGHDGARQMDATATTTRPFVMETRDRGTGDRTAADVVVQPGAEVRAPVTGTVVRGGSYTLYCDHVDEYVVIEPDGHPGWEVKLLHFEGLRVGAGARVEAGVTHVGTTARVLPFESQIDEFTAEPSWPHLHLEVVDTSIPDRPNPGGGGGCS